MTQHFSCISCAVPLCFRMFEHFEAENAAPFRAQRLAARMAYGLAFRFSFQLPLLRLAFKAFRALRQIAA